MKRSCSAEPILTSRNIILIHSSRHCRRISVRSCRSCAYYLRRMWEGILTLEFDKDGNLEFQVSAEEGDYLFDEIGSGLKIRQYQLEKRELLESLELFYRVVFLGESIEDQE